MVMDKLHRTNNLIRINIIVIYTVLILFYAIYYGGISYG